MTEPYTFDMAYARCYAVPEMAMDKRHVYMLHDVLDSGFFDNALEIGSFNGASSTAFVEAVNEGVLGKATFCDVQPTHSLKAVVGNCKYPDRVRIDTRPSWELLASDEWFDFVLVDGNHDLASVSRELEHLVRRKPLCVMAHDTNATEAGYPACEGAKLLGDTFRDMAWYCFEDRKRREGERTERGLFLATDSPDLALAARSVWQHWV